MIIDDLDDRFPLSPRVALPDAVARDAPAPSPANPPSHVDALVGPRASLEVLRLGAPVRAVSDNRALAVGDRVTVGPAGVGFGKAHDHMRANHLTEWIETTSAFGRKLGTLKWSSEGWRLLHLGGGGVLWIDDEEVGGRGRLVRLGAVIALGVHKEIAFRFDAEVP